MNWRKKNISTCVSATNYFINNTTMPKEEIIGRRTIRGAANSRPLPQNSKPLSRWRLKRLSELTAKDPSLWGISWAILWRIMVLLITFRTVILVIRAFLYKLASIS